MSEMVERVANAISPWVQEGFEDAARAAIAAMREPTEDILDVGNTYIGYRWAVRDLWQEMIDEALNPHPELTQDP